MRPLYIFDLDGTIANIQHRVHLLSTDSPTRWNKFYDACDKDTPNDPVVRTMHMLLAQGAEIWVFSGRSDRVQRKTILWLMQNTLLPPSTIYDILVMRPEGDHRPDDELKQVFVDNMLHEDRDRLVAVFDDRKRVVDMWRKNGIACFQVADGDF